MISDVLSDACAEIDRYLRGGGYGDSEPQIRKVFLVMDAMRAYLDCPPNEPWAEQVLDALKSMELNKVSDLEQAGYVGLESHRKGG